MSGQRDFVIEVTPEPQAGQFRVRVESTAGEHSGLIALDVRQIGLDLGTVQTHVLASSARVRDLGPVLPTLEAPLREIGTLLFDAVLSGRAGALFTAARNDVERRGEVFRVVLRLPPELAVLPWELLYDAQQRAYVCRRSTLVRYVDAPEAVRRVEVEGPLRVLGMSAVPGSLDFLDAASERRRLTEALAPLRERGLVELDWVAGERWEDLMTALLSGGPYHLFHFIGHGGFDAIRGEGTVAFADERGEAQPIPASRLSELLSLASPMPHLVVLNSCATAAAVTTDVFSSAGATLVRRVPAVVAMQFSITDEAATTFAAAFYQALAHNRGVDEAVRVGRIGISSRHIDTLEWITPVLYMRTHDTHLLTVERPTAVTPTTPPTPATPPAPIQAPIQAPPQVPAGTSGEARDVRTRAVAQIRGTRTLFSIRGTRRRLFRPWFYTMAFSPDGSVIVTGSSDSTVCLWDALDGRLLQTLTGHLKSVLSVAFSPDGTLLASGSADGTVRLWDGHNGGTLGTLTGQAKIVEHVAFSPDGQYLATSGGATVVLYDGRGDRVLRSIPVNTSSSFVFSPDSSHLATADGGSVRVWDPRTGDLVRRFTAHTSAIRELAYSPDGAILATASEDKTVRLWSPGEGSLLHTVNGHRKQVDAVVFSPDGTLFVTAGGDGTTRFWDRTSRREVHTIDNAADGSYDAATDVVFSPDGDVLVERISGVLYLSALRWR
ncbi:CHAT domain-containing protein [Streptomyces goshikiensis]|uniref:CHAT domain-containing protein n=1 Tax=Streptomyces goshikiensis TaxID=1942 RepID=UPI003649A6AF